MLVTFWSLKGLMSEISLLTSLFQITSLGFTNLVLHVKPS